MSKNTKIEHFIYFSNKTTDEVRYYNVGLVTEEGLCGFGCDYVGGGEYQEYVIVNGEVFLDEDEGDFDVESEHLLSIVGSDNYKAILAKIDILLYFDENMQPALNKDMSEKIDITFFNDNDHEIRLSTTENIKVVDFGNTFAEELQSFCSK